MGEYRGMKQRPTKRVTVESPLTPEAIAKNKTRGSGIVTIGTTIGVPRGYVDEIKLWFYSKIAFILLTPAEEDCSFFILKWPSSFVWVMWGPVQTSFE